MNRIPFPTTVTTLPLILDAAREGDPQAEQIVQYASAGPEMATALLTARTTLRMIWQGLPSGHQQAKIIEIELAGIELALAKAGIDPWAGERLTARAAAEWDALPAPFVTGFVAPYREEAA